MLYRFFAAPIALSFVFSLALAMPFVSTDDAFAQDMDLSDEELAAIAAAEAEADANVAQAEGEVITVTGSAIKRKEVSTPAPITIVGAADIADTGVNHIGDILQDLPEQNGGSSSQTNNNSGSGLGISTISLRALGATRTLVLLNGRRVVAGGGGASAVVDIGVIPTAMIERVEVLNDGASTVYGSDAVGGVVNIITKQNYKGVTASAYTGLAEHGGGEELSVNAVGGARNKRGGFVVSAGFNKRGAVLGAQRDWAKVARAYDYVNREPIALGSATTPSGTIVSPAADRAANPGNAEWQAVVDRNPADTGSYYRNPETGLWNQLQDEDRYNFAPEQYLYMPNRRINTMVSADYALTKGIQVYAEGLYNNQFVDARLAAMPLNIINEGQAVASANSFYNPFGRDFSRVQRRLLEFGNRVTEVDQNTARGVVGLRGQIPLGEKLGEWDWDLSGNYGRTWATTTLKGLGLVDRLANAVGPSTSATSCLNGGTDCVPLNLFGGAQVNPATGEIEGTITQEMIDYVGYSPVNKGYQDQITGQATLTGKLVDIPGGADARLAMGGLYRRESGAFQPDAEVGVGNVWGNKSEPIEGSFSSYEGFGELSIVPITNRDWAKWIEITLAGRVSHFDSYGTNFAYKVGGLWTIASGLSVRGTYSTAFRAPSVANLFSGISDSFDSANDPCSPDISRTQTQTAIANCNADGVGQTTQTDTQLPTKVGGNPDLNPEQAKIFTAGLTFEPEALPNFSLAVDYFNIDVTNQINRLGAALILQNCYQAAGDSRSLEDCDKIERDGTGQLTRINDRLTNTEGGTDTDGLDIKVGYKRAIGNLGTFAMRFQGSYLFRYNFIQNSGFETNEDGEVVKKFRTVRGAGNSSLAVLPRFRGNLGLRWGRGPINAGGTVRYLHSLDECQSDLCQPELGEGEEAVAPVRRPINVTADLFAGYAFDWTYGKSNLGVGVNNILDQDPVQFFNGSGATVPIYDAMGRFYYMRFSHSY